MVVFLLRLLEALDGLAGKLVSLHCIANGRFGAYLAFKRVLVYLNAALGCRSLLNDFAFRVGLYLAHVVGVRRLAANRARREIAVSVFVEPGRSFRHSRSH